MKLKLDANGNVVLQNGMPVYVHDDGSESPFDAAGVLATLKARNAEAKSNRERAEAAEASLKVFEGLDPAKAREAVEIASKLDAKKLIDAGQVDKLTADINKTWQEKLTASESRAATLEQRFKQQVLGTAFAASTFLTEKTTLIPEIAQAYFGQFFTVGDDGVLHAKDPSGSTLLSKRNPGVAADFEEALELIVQSNPRRDHILKSTQRSGSGAPGGGGTGGDGKTLHRAQFDALSPAQQAAHVKGGGEVVDAAA